MSIFAVNIVTIIGLGLAIDYGLFMVSRFREEIRRQPDAETALARTMATAGRTVAVSGITVAISLAGLLIFPQVFLRSMGFGGMSAVLVAMLAALTLLPALLAMLGPRVDALSVRRGCARLPPSRRRAGRRRTGAWYRIARSVMRRPVLYAVVVTARADRARRCRSCGCSSAAIDVRVLPAGKESRIVAETIDRDFPPSTRARSTSIVTLPDAVDSAAGRRRCRPYVGAVADVPGGRRRDGDRRGRRHRPGVGRLRRRPGRTRPRATWCSGPRRAGPGGARVLVGGQSATLADLLASLGRLLPWMALMVVATTFVLLFLAFGSVVLPVKALLMNVLSLGASFGAMVWIFQDGPPVRVPGLHPDRLRRGDPADPRAGDRLRAVDGLRGLPACPGSASSTT